MIKHITFVITLLVVTLSYAQLSIEEFDSFKLNEKRKVSLFVPENYSKDKKYPLVVVLDADYLFDVVVANTQYYSYFDEMPESIVVGIHSSKQTSRSEEFATDEISGLPKEKASNFFEFLAGELIPQLQKKYSIANFKTIVGHGKTANFINYFLLKEQPIFDAYISLSPELAEQMDFYIPKKLSSISSMKFYYLATSAADEKINREGAIALHTSLIKLGKSNVNYYFSDFEKANHSSVASYGLPVAFERIFSIYKPISPEEYREKILVYERPVFEYLTEKYTTIEELFGFSKKATLNDIMAIYAASLKKEDNVSLEKLGELCRKLYPETILGHYFLGEYFEKIGEPKKALRSYQTAFTLEPIDFVTRDIVHEKIEAIKRDFGW